jgi:uncharacterized protein (UPF0261 family)
MTASTPTAPAIYAIATMDTKGEEIDFIAGQIRACGGIVVTVDVGTKDPAAVAPGVSREAVAGHHPGGAGAVLGKTDRGHAVAAMAEALAAFMLAEHAAAKVAGVIGVGGSGGTALIAPAMRALPVGLPKVLVSTVASGNVAPYVGASDVAMMYSVTDVAGLNRVSKVVLGNAAKAVAGMVLYSEGEGTRANPETDVPPVDPLRGRPIGRVLTKMGRATRQRVVEALTEQKKSGLRLGEILMRMGYVSPADVEGALAAQQGAAPARAAEVDRPAIGLTMFGVTTPCVTAVRKALEDRYDCLTFHATGTGGQAMEKLVESGLIDGGVIDVTTTEVADLIVGGVFACLPSRFDVILEKRVPYVLSVGALDMVNFGARDTVPARFAGRKFHVHNPQVTLMRTTADENRQFARFIAGKLNRAAGPFVLLIPEKGVSALDAPGGAFWDPEADAALFSELEAAIQKRPGRVVRRLPHHVNDPEFAQALTTAFLEVARASRP